MSFLIKFIIVIVLIYYIIKFVFKKFGTRILNYTIQKLLGNDFQYFNNNQKKPQKEDLKIKKKIDKNTDGEYVDYEEIKD